MNTKHIYQLLSNHIKWHTKILIAVSGWVDSMTIFDIIYLYFLKFGYNTRHIYIWHYNHAFREESKQEEIELSKYFADKNINWITDKYKWSQFDEKSLRDARRNFLNKIINQNQINFIITWHHADDQLETTIINQIRWAGLKWTINMQEFTNANIYMKYNKYHQSFLWILRPLLQTRKIDIYKYAHDLWLKYREDHTNHDENISLRNYIRKQINSLTDISTEVYENLIKNHNIYIETLQNIFSQDINNIYINELSCEKRYIDLDRIYIVENLWETWSTNQIVYILDQFGLANNITKDYIEDLRKFLLYSQSGYKQLDKFTRLFVAHGNIYIVKYLLNNSKKQFENSYLDYYNNLALHFPEYKLRLPEAWDRFHGKSINEYLSNKKIPVFYRPYIVLQVDQNDKIVNTFLDYEMINWEKVKPENLKLIWKL